MVQFILIRPGSTDFDEQGRVQGTLDVPLNLRGDQEVAQLISQLRDRKFDVIYYAPCESAQQTATALADSLQARVKKVDALCNLNHGLWQGMRIDEIKRKHPKVYRQWQEQPEIVQPPGGETLDVVRERVGAAMRKLLKKHKRGVIGLVAPEPLASVIHSFLSHKELGNLWAASADHGSWDEFNAEPHAIGQR